jgi:hypothetical protein
MIDKAALILGLPITRPLQVGRIGSFYYLGLVTINTTDTTLTHGLGRVPSGYIAWRSQAGGIVTDGTNLGSDWTTDTVVLRATVSGKYAILLA